MGVGGAEREEQEGGFSATGDGAPGVGPGVRLWVSYPETSTEGSSRAAEICIYLHTFVCAYFPSANPLPTPPPLDARPAQPLPQAGAAGAHLAMTLRGYANSPFPPYHLTKRPSGTLLLMGPTGHLLLRGDNHSAASLLCLFAPRRPPGALSGGENPERRAREKP